MGNMLAFLQSDGTVPVTYDFSKIFVKTGAISLAATFRINVGTESGPAALHGWRFWGNLAIPFVLNVMFGIEGCGLGPLSGILVVSSFVYND